MNEEPIVLKVMTKSGHTFQLLATEQTLAELFRDPKFVQFSSGSSEIMMSLDDITAFEILPEAETLKPTTDLPKTDNLNAETDPPTNG